MSDNKIFYAKGDDPLMVQAFKNAQLTFKYFWRELSWEYRRIIPGLSVACVKVAFTQEVSGREDLLVEHMWVNEVNYDGDVITGVLLNQPRELTNVEVGQTIRVSLDQISDWLFAIYQPSKSKGVMKMFSSNKEYPVSYGGFTIQAMRSAMSKRERKEHDEAWGIDFGDPSEVLVVSGQKEKPENLIEHPMSKNMKEELVKFLAENPEMLNDADEDGFTMLHRETIAGNLSSIEVLLTAGADKEKRSAMGKTAMDYARQLNWEHIIPVLQK